MPFDSCVSGASELLVTCSMGTPEAEDRDPSPGFTDFSWMYNCRLDFPEGDLRWRLVNRFLQGCSWDQHLHAEEQESRTGQREKLSGDAFLTKASADLMGLFGDKVFCCQERSCRFLMAAKKQNGCFNLPVLFDLRIGSQEESCCPAGTTGLGHIHSCLSYQCLVCFPTGFPLGL